MFKKILFLLLAVLCVNGVFAQKPAKKVTITGTVLNADKAPVANAIVMIDDQKTNSITDANGKYKVKVKPTAAKISIISFINGTYEDSIKGRSQIDINFGSKSRAETPDTDLKPGDQGVNTGYGLVKQKNLTTTVNKIDGTNKKYASYQSISQMIEREVSGVRISGGSVIIQGSADLFGEVPALIVVDGNSSYSLPDIPPSYVKSIEVLKGTSAAIYGSRGYGGVIIIKTKVQNE